MYYKPFASAYDHCWSYQSCDELTCLRGLRYRTTFGVMARLCRLVLLCITNGTIVSTLQSKQ